MENIMSSRTPTISPEDKKRHEVLFRQNHVLRQRDLNQDITHTPISQKGNDSSIFDDSDLIMTPITHNEVKNNPKTPAMREEHHRKPLGEDSPFDFVSPIKDKHGNRVSVDEGLGNGKLSKDFPSLLNDTLSSTPEQKTNNSSNNKILNSILKKNNKVTYDKDTSQKLVKLKPELSSALNENGELNPLKVSKSVVISPKKEYITIRNHDSSKTKFSSPLTDSIDGRAKRDFKSPYVASSPKRSKSKLDNQWVDDEDETYSNSDNKAKKSKKAKRSWLKSTFRTLVDPQLPYVLSLYLQLLFNVAIVSILLYFIYSFISTVRADVENKVDSYATDILQEIALCSREYLRNNCQPGQRVVALESACSEWERCMNRDPTTVGRAKIGAETFAEIINGFIKPISWKSMFFLLLITVGSLVLTNAAFGTYRNHVQYDPNGNVPMDNGPRPQNGGSGASIPQTPMQPIYQTPHQVGYGNYTKFYTPRVSPSSTRHRSIRSAKKIRS